MFEVYAQDPEVARYLSWLPHTDLSQTQAAIDRFLARWQAQIEFFWFLFTREELEMVGAITARTEEGGFNLGFLLARSHWGQGLMIEAINAVTEWAFSQPSVLRITAACDLENRASARALEKAGFQREGVLKAFSTHPNISPDPRDCYSYFKARAGDGHSPG